MLDISKSTLSGRLNVIFTSGITPSGNEPRVNVVDKSERPIIGVIFISGLLIGSFDIVISGSFSGKDIGSIVNVLNVILKSVDASISSIVTSSKRSILAIISSFL